MGGAGGRDHGRTRRGAARAVEPSCHLRRAGDQGRAGAAAHRREAQGSEGLEADRHARSAAGFEGEDGRLGAVHDGRLPARHADRADRAAAALRRQGEQLRPVGRAQGAGGQAGRRGADRGRRARRWLLVGTPGTRGAEGRVGRHGGRDARQRGALQLLPHACTAARDARETPGRSGRGDRPRGAGARGGLRVPVSGACADGAARLRGAPRARRLRGLGGSQAQTTDQYTVAKVFDLSVEKVQIHTLLAGGSFGRRATPNGDVAGEAASIVKAIGGRQPVKLIWTREDDIRGGRYRPLYVHYIRAGLDPSGRIVGWQHRIVGQSILRGTPFEHVVVKNGIDKTSVEGAANLPYAVGDIAVELQTTDVGVPVLWWRSVGSTHTAFSTETFIDELAHAAKRDPVEYRRKLLKGHPRHLAALELAAQKAGWGTPLPAGRARGVAVHESFNTAVAQIAEVSLGADGLPRVERVVCAVDCGTAVNPDVVRAQMEGGIGFGLGAALLDEITLFEGRVTQSNFHDYRPIRVERMPAIEVHIVPSTAAPTGVGEPGVPPIAPAVANAMFALTGKRVRRLPFARHEA